MVRVCMSQSVLVDLQAVSPFHRYILQDTVHHTAHTHERQDSGTAHCKGVCVCV